MAKCDVGELHSKGVAWRRIEESEFAPVEHSSCFETESDSGSCRIVSHQRLALAGDVLLGVIALSAFVADCRTDSLV